MLSLIDTEILTAFLINCSRGFMTGREKNSEPAGDSVHAKVAVADSGVCFVTCENIIGCAMERNMEAGIGHLTSLFHKNLVSIVYVVSTAIG